MTDPLGERPTRSEQLDRPPKHSKPGTPAKGHREPVQDNIAAKLKLPLVSRRGHDDIETSVHTSTPQQVHTDSQRGSSYPAHKPILSNALAHSAQARSGEVQEGRLNPKARPPPHISPPALKRFRSGDISNSSYDDDQSSRSIATSKSNRMIFHSDRDSTSSTASRRAAQAFSRWEHGSGLSGFRLGHGLGQEDDTYSTAGSSTSSARSSKCAICLKSSERQYDKLKKCLSCHRFYHEACRRPSLIEGADPDSWTCFRCEPRKKLMKKSSNSFSNRVARDADRSDVQKDKLRRVSADSSSLPVKKDLRTPPFEQVRSLQSPDVIRKEIHTKSEGAAIRPPLHVTIPSENVEHHVHASSARCPTQVRDLRLDAQDMHNKKESVPLRAANASAHKLSAGCTLVAEDHLSLGDQSDEDELEKLIFATPVSAGSLNERRVNSSAGLHTRSTAITDALAQGRGRVYEDHSPLSLTRNTSIDPQLSPVDNEVADTIGHTCLICQRVRIWGGKADNVICQSCKNRKSSIQNDETLISIPETPPQIPLSSVQSGSRPNTATTRDRSNTTPSASFFQAAALGSRAKIRSKELPIAAIRLSRDRSLSPTHQRKSSNRTELVDQDRGQLTKEHNYTLPPMASNFCSDVETAQADFSSTADAINAESTLHRSQNSLFDESPPNAENVSPQTDEHDLVPDTNVDSSNNMDIDATMLHPKRVRPCQKSTVMDPQVLQNPSRRSKREHSCRELFAMALLASGGVSRTIAQVKSWITETFPGHYQMAESGWQNSISATPYSQDLKDDLSKERRSSHKAWHWGFASVEIRDKWAAKFPEYDSRASSRAPSEAIQPSFCTLASPQAIQSKDLGSTTSGSLKGRACNPGTVALLVDPGNKQPIIPHGGPHSNSNPRGLPKSIIQSFSHFQSVMQQQHLSLEDIREATESFASSVETAHQNQSQHERSSVREEISMPFESDLDFQTKSYPFASHESKFFLAYPEYTMPSIEMMTEAQVMKKREEIRQRPSRKHTFRKRLAFATSDRHVASKAQKGERIDVDNLRGTGAVVVEDDIWAILNVPRDPIPLLDNGNLILRSRTQPQPTLVE